MFPNTEGLPGPEMTNKLGKLGIIIPKKVLGPFFQYFLNLMIAFLKFYHVIFHIFVVFLLTDNF